MNGFGFGGKNGGGFDWKGNGNKDAFDHYMDMKVTNLVDSDSNSSSTKKSNYYVSKGISMGGKPLYDASKDSNSVAVFKFLLVVFLCFGGIVLPVILETGPFGTLLCIFGGIGISISILKNV